METYKRHRHRPRSNYPTSDETHTAAAPTPWRRNPHSSSTHSIAEILLRLPPDDPECLLRASLVCKLWRRILSESTFRHRYREFHQTPPLLGFLRSTFCDDDYSRFVPIKSPIPFHQPKFGCRALDCRHGRVLFDTRVDGPRGSHYAVWDPITGNHKDFSDPINPNSFSPCGVVLCAAAGCSHRGCQDGPFIVVLVKLDGTNASAWVYSSKSDEWSAPATLQLPEASHVGTGRRGAIVGDQIYILPTGTLILKYDLGKHCLTTIRLPCYVYNNCFTGILMTMDNGSSLGFVAIKDSTLHLWARKVDLDGSMGWVQDRVVSLNNLAPIIPWCGHTSMIVIGFAEGVDFLLLRDGGSTFIFELESSRLKKLNNPGYDFNVFPYLSFYIPDFGSRKLPLPVETKL